MTTTATTLRAYRGPAILSYGFRPFFLGGAIWSAAAMVLFILMLMGRVALPTAFTPTDWHAHELLYGFLPAIIAGFLLTAIPNWTGRLPVAGMPLGGLFAIWLAGRIAVATSSLIGPAAAAFADLSFLIALGFIVGREIIAGKNTGNLKVLALVALLGAGNLTFHIEAATGGTANYGKRLGIAAAILLITLVGGRIVPSFTRNWLARRGAANLPAQFGKFDLATIAASAIALLAWVAAPESLITAAACALAGLFQFARLARWNGYRTFAEPLVFVLHVGYIFLPIGFLLVALSSVFPGSVPAVAAIHAWTAGAIGIMTLAVMTRASLGHTGQPLAASTSVLAIYVSVAIGAAARLMAAFGIEPDLTLNTAAAGWTLAFLGFALAFGRLLAQPR
jgi:uncharacterized protein involved in response to NO